MSLNRYLKSHTLQFYSVYQSDTAFLIIHRKDKTITGLTVTGSNDYTGLFGRIGSGGTVKDVTLTKASVTGGNYVGGVAGQNDGTVENCSVDGTVTGTGLSDTGGIVGTNYGTISGCSAEGTVTGDVNVGGIAGGSYLGVIIEGCHSTAAVSGSSTVGGIVGFNSSGTFTACYWSSNPANGIGKMDSGTNGTAKVDGTNVKWEDTIDPMNTALKSAGSALQYNLGVEGLPALE